MRWAAQREISLGDGEIEIQLTHTFEDTDSSAEVIHSSGSLEGSGDDRGGGDEIVGEGVVEVALIDSDQPNHTTPGSPRLAAWAAGKAEGRGARSTAGPTVGRIFT